MNENQTLPNPTITRREFLKSSAFLGGTTLIAGSVPWALSQWGTYQGPYLTPTEEYALAWPENIIYSACLACHVRCTIKVKQRDGVVVKIDGSPYAAKTFLPNIPYETSPLEAAKIDGKLCPKGQAGVQILYDPYRLRKVLKRKPGTRRGEGQWVTIEFDKAIDEIVNGGDLFGEGPVPGLKDIWALRDPKVAAEMAADVDAIKARKMTVAEFKQKHAAHLAILIDPDSPDLGPKNNQLVFMPGRINRGRAHFSQRWLFDAFGSVNWFEHTSICEQSHHIATKEMTRDLATGASKEHFKPDFLNAEFVIHWGTGSFEANFGSTAIAELTTRPYAERNQKFAVIDPRLSKTAAKAWRWVPVKPGGDAALALGMIRWIIENGRYDKRYLENPNQAAAKQDGEPTSTDATHLVRTDTLLFLRAEDIGLPVPPPEEGKPKLDYFVVMTSEGPRRYDEAQQGLLEVDTTIRGIPVKSVFTLLKERAFERTLEQWAELSGVPVKTIVELANEFTSHGKQAAIDSYRGPVKHTNGYYAQQAILTLNMLIGSMDWKGGLADGGGSWDDLGGKEGQPFPLAKLHRGKIKSFGVTLTREKWKYEDSTLFERDGGYPAKRPWYPFTANVWQEVIPSAAAGYPYPIKALWLHMASPVMAIPGGGELVRFLTDPKVTPLVIATDVVVGETTIFADYVFPDLSYLERWASPGDNPQPSVKSNPFRQPAAPPIPESVRVYGEEMPVSMEAVMPAIAEKLKLPGFGQDGFGPGMDFKRPEDYYLKLAANLAVGDKPDGSDAVPDASDEELDLFRKARRYLPPTVYDEARWRAAVGENLWRKVVYMLNRGGRFEDFGKAYQGDYMAHQFGKPFHLYVERVARQRDSITGKRYDGLARYDPPMNSNGKLVDDREYPFLLNTYKEVFGTQTRTPGNYWSQSSIVPENFVLLNRQDARRLGLQDGDLVKLVSRTNPDGLWPLGNGRARPIVGRVHAIEGLRPGVATVSHHYGHWAYGAQDVMVDGIRVPGDPRRGTGLAPNNLMLVDEYNTATPLTDPIGGSASFFDTRVKMMRV